MSEQKLKIQDKIDCSIIRKRIFLDEVKIEQKIEYQVVKSSKEKGNYEIK